MKPDSVNVSSTTEPLEVRPLRMATLPRFIALMTRLLVALSTGQAQSLTVPNAKLFPSISNSTVEPLAKGYSP